MSCSSAVDFRLALCIFLNIWKGLHASSLVKEHAKEKCHKYFKLFFMGFLRLILGCLNSKITHMILSELHCTVASGL